MSDFIPRSKQAKNPNALRKMRESGGQSLADTFMAVKEPVQELAPSTLAKYAWVEKVFLEAMKELEEKKEGILAKLPYPVSTPEEMLHPNFPVEAFDFNILSYVTRFYVQGSTGRKSSCCSSKWRTSISYCFNILIPLLWAEGTALNFFDMLCKVIYHKTGHYPISKTRSSCNKYIEDELPKEYDMAGPTIKETPDKLMLERLQVGYFTKNLNTQSNRSVSNRVK